MHTPVTLKETAERVCTLNRTTLTDVIEDLQSMRMIGCGAVHERGPNTAAMMCKFRGDNLSCLHAWTKMQMHPTIRDSVLVRLKKYVEILAEIYADSQDEELRALVGFSHPNQNVKAIAGSTSLHYAMKETENNAFGIDGRANHFHSTLPILDACAAIKDEQTDLGKTVKRYRDRILAVFMRLQLRA